jgi:hypothetical protein
MNDANVERNQVEGTQLEKPQDLLNVTELVRSLQRREGNQGCFRKAEGSCDREDCFCRPWCLKSTEDPGKEE